VALSFCGSEGGCAAVWALSRLLQPAGFIGLIKLFTVWVPYTRMGRSLGAMSLAMYSVDALSRVAIGTVRDELGWHWRTVNLASGLLALLVTAPSFMLVQPHPRSLGLASVPANPHAEEAAAASDGGSSASAASAAGKGGAAAVAAAAAAAQQQQQQQQQEQEEEEVGAGLGAIVCPLLRSGMFWLVCATSLLLTSMREVFNTLDTDLLQTTGASQGTASSLSSAFPLCGVPSCVLCGWLVDRFNRRRNGEIVVVFSVGLLACCVGFAQSPPELLSGVLLAASGFFLIGPYSLLAGVFAADLGGQRSAGTASSLIDFCGYAGSIAAMLVCGAFGEDYASVFWMMAALAAAVVGFGVLLTVATRRASTKKEQPSGVVAQQQPKSATKN